jgi:hypothetical protein
MGKANGADSPSEKQSATCGCIMLVVVLAVFISLFFWACSACGDDAGEESSTQGDQTSQMYTRAQYSQLAVGMTFEQVDAIMGGGGIMVAQEDVWSTLVYQNVDAAGSQITCSFEYDILTDYSEEGL